MSYESGNPSSQLGIRSLYVYTELGRNFALSIDEDESISKIKENICKEYTTLYSKTGDVKISVLKVKRRGCFFDLCDSVILKKLFSGPKEEWVLTVEFEKNEESADQNNTTTVVTEKLVEAATTVENTKTTKRRLKTAEASSEKVAKKRTKRSKKTVSAFVDAEHLSAETQTSEKIVDSNTLEGTSNVQNIAADVEVNAADVQVDAADVEIIAAAVEASPETGKEIVGEENVGEVTAMDTVVESIDNISVANPPSAAAL